MDDLLDNFANVDSPNLGTPSEERYIYHFVDGSPEPLEHDRPVHRTTPAEPTHETSFFNVESPPPYQSTGDENVDEGDYNADIDDYDDDDDDVFGYGPLKGSHFGGDNPTIDTSNNTRKPLFINNTTSLDRPYRNLNDTIMELHDLSAREESGDFKPASALNDGEQDLDGFKQHLRKFHRQDLERDELLAVRSLPSPLDPGAY